MKLETRVGIFVLAAIGVFVYMGFQIGAFRFDKYKYAEYTMYFKDVSGLARKGEVKIAGVKVGWVESIGSAANDEMHVEVKVMVLREYKLYSNAHGIVRQEGLLGPKYLEICVGDPLLPTLGEGGTLGEPGVAPVSMDELLHKFKTIAQNVEEVTDSVKNALGGDTGAEQLKSIFDNLNVTAEKMASFSDILERSFARNEDNLDAMLSMGTDVRRVTEKLELEVLPGVQGSIEKISEVFDRDFDRVATKIAATAEAFEEAGILARDSFNSINTVASKIDEGKGTIGKLINEEDTYRDLKVAIGGLKNYFSTVDKLQIIFDGHSETMHRPAENFIREDQKFYFDLRVHPDEDFFYLIGLVSSLKGWTDRYDVEKHYSDDKGHPIDVAALKLDDAQRVFLEFEERRSVYTRNTIKLNAQFGKIFSAIAFRVGLFEGTGGVGVDFDIPVKSDRFRWLTTFEMFDIAGWNRRDDQRPHLKWLNKMYVMRNLYFTFGADDFVSKHNASGFLGFGFRFGDDNVKYLFQSVGSAAAATGPQYCLSVG